MRRSSREGARGHALRNIVIGVLTGAIGVLGFGVPFAAAESGRGYELVTPPDLKGQGTYIGYPDLANNGHALLPSQIHDASEDGDRFIYNTGLRPAPGSPASNISFHYLAERTADGWNSTYTGSPSKPAEGILPRASTPAIWSSDLSRIVTVSPDRLNLDDPGNGNPDDYADFDLFAQDRDQFATGNFEWLSRSPIPLHPSGYGVTPSAASLDARVVVFQSGVALTPDSGSQGNLYIQRRGGTPQLSSVYPDGTPAAVPVLNSVMLSRDGEAMVFIANASESDPTQHVFVRRFASGQTADLGPSIATYEITRSGDDVIYATSEPRPGDTDTSQDLYRYHIATGTSTRLSVAASGAPDNGNQDSCSPTYPTSACTASPTLTSDDGAVVYFLSPERLTPPGSSGPQLNEPNLYRSDSGGVRFVATLAPADASPDTESFDIKDLLSPTVATRPVRSTPDGSLFLFESVRKLTDADNAGKIATYIYRASTGEVRCVSCPVAGMGPAEATPVDDRGLPDASNGSMAVGGRAFTDDGRSLFFDTTARMVASDINGKMDVYRYDTSTGGVSLISTGTGGGSYYADSSRDGRDVFFQTRDSLVATDRNGPTAKIYDARVGGGFPDPPADPPCDGQCVGSPTAPPAAGVANSARTGTDDNVKSSARTALTLASGSARDRRRSRTYQVPIRVRASRTARARVRLYFRLRGRDVLAGGVSVALRAHRTRVVRISLRSTARAALRRGPLRLRAVSSVAGSRSETLSFTWRKP